MNLKRYKGKSLKWWLSTPTYALRIIKMTPALQLGNHFDSLRNPMVPPARLTAEIGGGNFLKGGLNLREELVKLGGLKRSDDVLDVGCGIGRVAVALTGFLDKSARYEGFDIMKHAVTWCQNRVTPRHPNFRFTHADVINPHYNPQGQFKGDEYVFPYKDESFDFIFLTSVFTHMLYPEVDHYLSEISRVLRPNAKAFITVFLINEASLEGIEKGVAGWNFQYLREDGCRVADLNNAEAAIAYPETEFQSLCVKNGLQIQGTDYGSWPGIRQSEHFQDVVIVTKAH